VRGLGFLFTQSEKQMPRFVRIFGRWRVVGVGNRGPKAGALPSYASSWTLAGTGGRISWKQQSIQSSDRENDPPF